LAHISSLFGSVRAHVNIVHRVVSYPQKLTNSQLNVPHGTKQKRVMMKTYSLVLFFLYLFSARRPTSCDKKSKLLISFSTSPVMSTKDIPICLTLCTSITVQRSLSSQAFKNWTLHSVAVCVPVPGALAETAVLGVDARVHHLPQWGVRCGGILPCRKL